MLFGPSMNRQYAQFHPTPMWGIEALPAYLAANHESQKGRQRKSLDMTGHNPFRFRPRTHSNEKRLRLHLDRKKDENKSNSSTPPDRGSTPSLDGETSDRKETSKSLDNSPSKSKVLRQRSRSQHLEYERSLINGDSPKRRVSECYLGQVVTIIVSDETNNTTIELTGKVQNRRKSSADDIANGHFIVQNRPNNTTVMDRMKRHFGKLVR